MRETGTTVLSLALAMILVSSLSSGVIYADREREVVILDCRVVAGSLVVTQFDSFPAIGAGNLPLFPPFLIPATVQSCAESVAFLLNNKFKMEDVTQATVGFIHATIRYTFVKK